MEQYLQRAKLEELASGEDTSSLKILSQDTYSDLEIWNTIKRKNAVKMLLFCAIQTAIVGFGNKTFGEFEYNGDKVSVKGLYKEYGVKDDLNLSAKIEPGDLTPRRLQRFFRVQIYNYLEKHPEISPYLWKKYSNLDPEFRTITFPGAESFVETASQGKYLLNTYKTLDYRADTNICERIQRVLLARGILTIQEVKESLVDITQG
jgi:hypothetical protein